ncbi:MAG: hypothetical protein PHD15_04665 [Clostridia bacterium]|nr:hypothetical protein [Clostridia bacterium]MDD4387032.1 hypothetical protein [Clostridia bacterium]
MENSKYEKLDFSKILLKRFKKLTPVLNEYFSRVKADLNLSDEQINHKVNLLCKNVNGIKFQILPVPVIGGFDSKSHKIYLNANLFNYQQDYEKLFGVLTHELDHACSYNEEDKKSGMYKIQGDNILENNEQDIILDEMRTEIGATRRVFNDNYIDDEKMIRKTSGYNKGFTLFTTVLQNSLGINEKEFLKKSDQGRYAFDKQMESKFLDSKDYYKFMEKFSLHTSILFNEYIEKRENPSFLSDEFGESYNEFRKLSYVGLNLRMEKDILDDPNLNIDEYVKNMRYSIEENKSHFNFFEKEACRVYDHNGCCFAYTPPNKPSNAQNMLESKILYLEMLLDNKELLGDKYNDSINKITSIKEASELKDYAKEQLNLEFKDNQEIKFEKELDSKTVAKRKSEKCNSYNWNNSEIEMNLEHFLDMNKNKIWNRLMARIMRNLYPNEIDKVNYLNKKQILEKKTKNKNDQKLMDNPIKSQDEILNLDKDRIIASQNQEVQKSENIR